MHKRHTNLKQAAVFVSIGFLVVASGVASGLFFATKYLLPSTKSFDAATPLSRVIKIGQKFPSLHVQQKNGEPTSLNLASGQRERIIAFLSGDCGACSGLLSLLRTDPAIVEKKVDLLLLAADPTSFSNSDQSDFYTISRDELRLLDIRLFPTLVRVNRTGIVTGLDGNLTPAKLSRFLANLQT